MALGRWALLLVSMFPACGGAVAKAPAPVPAATATATATARSTATPNAPPTPAGPKAEASLAERLAARLRALLPGARVETRGDAELRLWPKNGKGGDEGLQIFLDNLRSQCADPASCDAAVEHFARTLADYSTRAEREARARRDPTYAEDGRVREPSHAGPRR